MSSTVINCEASFDTHSVPPVVWCHKLAHLCTQ